MHSELPIENRISNRNQSDLEFMRDIGEVAAACSTKTYRFEKRAMPC